MGPPISETPPSPETPSDPDETPNNPAPEVELHNGLSPKTGREVKSPLETTSTSDTISEIDVTPELTDLLYLNRIPLGFFYGFENSQNTREINLRTPLLLNFNCNGSVCNVNPVDPATLSGLVGGDRLVELMRLQQMALGLLMMPNNGDQNSLIGLQALNFVSCASIGRDIRASLRTLSCAEYEYDDDYLT